MMRQTSRLPSAATQTPRSASERRQQANAIFIKRAGTTKITGTMDKLRRDHREGAETKCMVLLGDPGVGKSAFLENYRDMAQVTPIVTDEGIRRPKPVVYVELPSDATVNVCADAILSELLGRSTVTNGRSKDGALEVQLRVFEVELLILDDFQHASDRGKEKTRSHTADFIKSITKRTRIPVVMAGIPSVFQLIEGNEQLRSICPYTYRIPSYRDNLKAFRKFLADFDAQLPFDNLSGLDEDERSAAVFEATGGLLRQLRHLLSTAVELAIDAGAPCIRNRDLHDAFETGAHDPSCQSNPFQSLPGV